MSQKSATKVAEGSRRSWRDGGWRDTVATWAGRLLLFAAFVSFVGMFVRHSAVLNVTMDLLGWFDVPSEPSLFAVCMALVLSGGVRRRFRAAHTALVVIMGLSVLDSLARLLFRSESVAVLNRLHIHGAYREWARFQATPVMSAVVLATSVAAFALVVSARPAFKATLSSGSRRAAVYALVGGLFVSTLITSILTFCFPRNLDTVGQRLVWSVRSAFGVRTPSANPGFGGHRGYEWIFVVGSSLSTLALLFAVLVLWRSGRTAGLATAEDELDVRRLLLEYGEEDSLGYFATRRDKAVLFSPDHRAAVTFRNEGSVSVASADPVGRPESWADAVDAWLDHCVAHGLYPAVLSASSLATPDSTSPPSSFPGTAAIRTRGPFSSTATMTFSPPRRATAGRRSPST